VKHICPPGTKVRLEYDVQLLDKYGRILAYIWLPDGRMLNEVIICSGYATPLTIPPDVKYADRFRRCYQTARGEGLGLWGAIQEFITPYTPEQNGIIERFFRSLKEECVCQRVFKSFGEARKAVRDWINWYNERRPHQALGYLSPVQYRAQKLTMVA
jgi:hypothetical protein